MEHAIDLLEKASALAIAEARTRTLNYADIRKQELIAKRKPAATLHYNMGNAPVYTPPDED